MKRLFLLIVISAVFTADYCYSQKGLVQDLSAIFTNGDIVSSNTGTLDGTLSKSGESYDSKIIGVYVQPPKQQSSVGGAPVLVPKGNYVADKGIVLLKYNSENGQIKKNDPLTASSVPGEAMKASQSGVIIGLAMEDAGSQSGLIQTRVMIQYLSQ